MYDVYYMYKRENKLSEGAINDILVRLWGWGQCGDGWGGVSWAVDIYGTAGKRLSVNINIENLEQLLYTKI